MLARRIKFAHRQFQVKVHRVNADAQYLPDLPAGLARQRPLQNLDLAPSQLRSLGIAKVDTFGLTKKALSGVHCEAGEELQRGEHFDQVAFSLWKGLIPVESEQEVLAPRKVQRNRYACAIPKRRLSQRSGASPAT